MVLPAEEHHDATSENIEPRFLLFGHGQAPFAEAGFPASPPARIRRREEGNKANAHSYLSEARKKLEACGDERIGGEGRRASPPRVYVV
nr:hypothetical protein DM860_004150 [Ipomoea trifida]